MSVDEYLELLDGVNDTTDDPTGEPIVAGRSGGISRFEKSLGLLTTKFVKLLQDAEGGTLDLREVRNSQLFCLKLFKFTLFI